MRSWAGGAAASAVQRSLSAFLAEREHTRVTGEFGPPPVGFTDATWQAFEKRESAVPRAYTQLRVSYAAAELRRAADRERLSKARNERP